MVTTNRLPKEMRSIVVKSVQSKWWINALLIVVTSLVTWGLIDERKEQPVDISRPTHQVKSKAENDGTYTVIAFCRNCKHKQRITLPKGTEVDTCQDACEVCGCTKDGIFHLWIFWERVEE